MRLSDHFTLAELTASQTAARRGINNTPDEATTANLIRLATKLEEVRSVVGDKPITISSGYRCPDLNRLVGSKPTSSHVKGCAADFHVDGLALVQVVEKIRMAGIQFDQLILEYYNRDTGAGWVHIGIGDKMRNEVLTINQHGTYRGVVA